MNEISSIVFPNMSKVYKWIQFFPVGFYTKSADFQTIKTSYLIYYSFWMQFQSKSNASLDMGNRLKQNA